ncbi:hypothetical protein LR48_Vigan03g173800 [Vigna angularis]|uniref:Uncharacterized protein n=1 Tax=Phaseolus angularis TaxID=3914 RepID=A0A0L9U6F9_PHAAN|nr:hypothetical protein LR48_Vigan03g173800 [Vigna angularis]
MMLEKLLPPKSRNDRLDKFPMELESSPLSRHRRVLKESGDFAVVEESPIDIHPAVKSTIESAFCMRENRNATTPTKGLHHRRGGFPLASQSRSPQHYRSPAASPLGFFSVVIAQPAIRKQRAPMASIDTIRRFPVNTTLGGRKLEGVDWGWRRSRSR